MNAPWFRYFFVVSVVVGALLVSIGFHEIAAQQKSQDTTSHILHALIINNQKLLFEQGETTVKSAKARITTVTQRCELTKLILNVLVKDDQRRAPAFERSYKGCEKQLVEVKQIAAKAEAQDPSDGI